MSNVSAGYEAVVRVGREQRPVWLGAIRACHDTIEKQVAAGLAEHTCARWIKSQTGVQVPPLRPLVAWGVLERKRWRVGAGHDLDVTGRRVYYLMPDRPGVARALAEFGA